MIGVTSETEEYKIRDYLFFPLAADNMSSSVATFRTLMLFRVFSNSRDGGLSLGEKFSKPGFLVTGDEDYPSSTALVFFHCDLQFVRGGVTESWGTCLQL